MNEAKYIVRGYVSPDRERGYDGETVAETLREAKEKAKYYLTAEYAAVTEGPRLALVEVIDRRTGSCVFDQEAR